MGHEVQQTTSLKRQLIDLLEPLDGFSVQPSRVACGSALFYRGKEFAHFHHEHEIDLRLTAKVIKSLGLTRPARSERQPGRSTSSAWIALRIDTGDDVRHVAELVRRAVAESDAAGRR